LTSVLICAAQTPFVTGGAEILVEDLERELRSRGHQVAVASIPFKWYPATDLVRQALAWRLLDVTESNGVKIDVVIATKFPTWVVEHPRKVAWIFHQHRDAYDLYGSPSGEFRDERADHREARDALRALDMRSLNEAKARFAISKNVAQRLHNFCQLEAETLYPPPRHIGRYRWGSLGDFLFAAGRLDRMKRLDLLIDAVAAHPNARLKIAGRGPLEGELRARIAARGAASRIELLGFVSDEELIDLYATCRAALYAPLDEDYGYVTVEAFLSAKTVITTDDAGGVLEFVRDQETGFVAPPNAAALGAAVAEALRTPDAKLREMGKEARRRVQHLSWDHTIDALLAAARA
jgi:glycosyltransferase involved in cell wall biosynthesis